MAAAYLLVWPWLAGFDRDWSWQWRIDPDQPWELTVGYGHVIRGLNTIRIDHLGGVEMYEEGHRTAEADDAPALWCKKSGTVDAATVGAVLQAIDDCGVMGWHRRYVARGIFSERRQAVWIRQGGREKYVFFEKSWPEPMKRFRERIHELLAGKRSPLRAMEWTTVPEAEQRKHDDALMKRNWQ